MIGIKDGGRRPAEHSRPEEGSSWTGNRKDTDDGPCRRARRGRVPAGGGRRLYSIGLSIALAFVIWIVGATLVNVLSA
jgi:hypothetical protein